MESLNLTAAKNSYQKVIDNPTYENKLFFIYEHKPYISSIMRKILHKDYFNYEDTMSELLVHMYRNVDKIDFSLGYVTCRNFLSTLTANSCKSLLIHINAQKYIPSHLISSISVYNEEEHDIFDKIIINEDKTIDDRIIILLEHAKKLEEPLVYDILSMCLDGWNVYEIARKLNKSNSYPRHILARFKKRLKKSKII